MSDYAVILPEIGQAIDALTIVDTHEHLPAWEKHRSMSNDVLGEFLIHYFNRDLVSAGLPLPDMERARDEKLPLMQRWALVAPYWEACRLTGYGRALDITAKGVYGIDGVHGHTLEALNDAYHKARAAGGCYRRVLKELCRIEASVLDGGTHDADPLFFRTAYNIGALVLGGSAPACRRLGRSAGMPVRSLADYLDAVDAVLTRGFDEQGYACLKSAMAYMRSLSFPLPAPAEAEAAFMDNQRAYGHLPDWDESAPRPAPAFENFVMHHILRFAGKRGLALQVHTGLQEGNGNILEHSRPTLLSNLFLMYPEVRFDLFHIAYPFQHELSALCKNFPNVFIDMCWAHIISPRASMLALDEWLDSVPYNKISAFGGDYCFVDAIYGHQLLARQDVARVLSRRVSAGDMSAQAALDVARAVFYDNPKRILGLR